MRFAGTKRAFSTRAFITSIKKKKRERKESSALDYPVRENPDRISRYILRIVKNYSDNVTMLRLCARGVIMKINIVIRGKKISRESRE